MDRNTITGLIVVGVILFGFSWYSNNQNEKLQEQKHIEQESIRVRDSIDRAEGRIVDPIIEPLEMPEPVNESGLQERSQIADSTHRARLGDFLVDAENSEEQFMTFSNEVMDIIFSTKGDACCGC